MPILVELTAHLATPGSEVPSLAFLSEKGVEMQTHSWISCLLLVDGSYEQWEGEENACHGQNNVWSHW